MLPKYPQQIQNPYYTPSYPRLGQLEVQQPYTPQYEMLATNSQPSYIKGRPVVSMEEARAAQIDLDGSLFVFTDIGNHKIYTKQINLDGIAVLKTYTLVEDTPTDNTYVTKTEFEKVITEIENRLLNPQAERDAENEQINRKQSRTTEETVRKQPTF